MCGVATGNCFTTAGKSLPLLKECKIMELVKGRGICCENEVYFDYVDGEIVMTMYRDVPGVRMDRRAPNVIKSFSINQWEEINGYLRETLDEVEGVFDDRDDGVIEIDSEGKVHPPEAEKVLAEIQELRKAEEL
ncbi:hypothetical protein LCGC14_1838070, partial [marine sediment metagenome]